MCEFQIIDSCQPHWQFSVFPKVIQHSVAKTNILNHINFFLSISKWIFLYRIHISFLLALCWIYIQKMQRRANYLCYGPIISSYTIITLCFKTNKKRRNQSTSWIIFAKRKYLWQKIEYHESCSNTISHFLYIVFNNILREHNIVLELYQL